MKIYLVGGAIRDALLDAPVTERDWVVVGSSPQEMIELGYKPIGKDFPVFLHPETKEEYALARTERKVKKGYQGFDFYFDADVRLEEDLKRRDLTINAIAKDQEGNLIDPYHGQQDIKNKTFRHVSDAFAEDPVRILRVARFAAKLPHFSLAEATITLMKRMSENGEVDALVAERVWKEFEKSLHLSSPQRFFEVLIACDAQNILWPYISDAEIQSLTAISTSNADAHCRFACLCHTLSKQNLDTLIKTYRIPKLFAELALLCQQHADDYRLLDTTCAESIYTLIRQVDGLRRPERLTSFCSAIEYGTPSSKQQLLQTAVTAIQQIDSSQLQSLNLKGKAFADALKIEQIKAIEDQLNY